MAKQDKYTAPRQTVVTNTPQVNSAEDVYIPSADEQLDKMKSYFDGKKRNLNIILGVVALGILGYFGYKWYMSGQETKAADDLAMANTFMLMDSTSWMIDGHENYKGSKYVADKYGSTKAGNTAAYMTGMGYLKQGKFKEAIKYLEAFDGNNSLLETIATGSLGDAYWENNQLDKAVACYEKAGSDVDNFQYAPVYLQRAGTIYEKQGKTKEAIAAYTKIKEKFSNSSVARDIDKYLAKLGVVAD